MSRLPFLRQLTCSTPLPNCISRRQFNVSNRCGGKSSISSVLVFSSCNFTSNNNIKTLRPHIIATAAPLHHQIRSQSPRRLQLLVPQPQQHYRSYSGAPPPPQGSVKFWPFFIIIGLGSLSYYALAQKRHEAAQQTGQKPAAHSSPTFPVAARAKPNMAPAATVPSSSAFSPEDVTVIFVLGGPGAGKGTQSAKLVSTYGFTHLSAGDLLRAEQKREGSQFGELISKCIRDGDIVPMEVTVKLLENAMREALLVQKKTTHQQQRQGDGDTSVVGVKGKFLVDGFPRKMDQAVRFEETVCPARFVLFYDCPEDELEKRLLERGKTSGRSDDNPDSIRKRFRTFVETSMPVVDHYEKEGRVVRVKATSTVDEVFERTTKQIKDRLGDNL